MKAVATSAVTAVDWDGPGARETRSRFSWKALVWKLVFPRRRHRIALTVPGVFLVVVALAIGTAAYNTASNILFITLSLLLACLLLSGLLSWFNFMGMSWRFRPLGPWRAGHETLVTIEARNGKRWLPTYSLWFEFAMQPRHLPDPEKDGKVKKVRDLLAAAEKHITRGQVFLHDRIEAGGQATLDWGLKPARRGEAVVELAAVGSLFPFGFLRKHIGTDLRREVLVWPAQVTYQWAGALAAPVGAGRRTAKSGLGEDLFALRKYQQGDSHRMVHWKASARLGQLMVRQFSAETHEGYVLRLEAGPALWPREEQFELACSLAATMAEDLFAAERLRGVVFHDGVFLEIRRLRDVEAWFDALARVQLAPAASMAPSVGSQVSRPARQAFNNLITFAPEGLRGVAAHVDGRKIASA